MENNNISCMEESCVFWFLEHFSEIMLGGGRGGGEIETKSTILFSSFRSKYFDRLYLSVYTILKYDKK